MQDMLCGCLEAVRKDTKPGQHASKCASRQAGNIAIVVIGVNAKPVLGLVIETSRQLFSSHQEVQCKKGGIHGARSHR